MLIHNTLIQSLSHPPACVCVCGREKCHPLHRWSLAHVEVISPATHTHTPSQSGYYTITHSVIVGRYLILLIFDNVSFV